MQVNENEKPITLFTIRGGISENLLALITNFGLPDYHWTDDPSKAAYFVLPVNYEVGHELTDFYLDYFRGVPEDRRLAMVYEEQLLSLARQSEKKILIFYYSDLNDPIPVENSLIFRTSILKSNLRSNEFAMPAFKNDLSDAYAGNPEFLPWKPIPAIGFRGQAQIHLKTKQRFYNRINLLLNRFGQHSIFKIKGNHGYLQRRNAMTALQKNSSILCDFTVTTEKDIGDPDSNIRFKDNLFSNPYNLCVSGYGNYSFRLYETLSAGRIPVFINTDCQLPFEDQINWKELLVWIEQDEIPFIGEKLLAFHQSKSNEEFIRHQQKLKDLWRNELSKERFFIRLKSYL